MKKIYLVSSVLLLTLSSGVAFAETSTVVSSSTLREKANERLQELKHKLASTSEEIKNVKKEIKTEIENRIGRKLDKEREKIANRFEEAIGNLKKLADRVGARIVKLESKGKDLSSQKVLLTDARAKITVAETELAAFESSLASTTISTSTRKESLKNLRTLSEKTKTAIKAAHRALVNVINSIKPGRDEENENKKSEDNNSSTSTTSGTSTSTQTNSTSSNQ